MDQTTNTAPDRGQSTAAPKTSTMRRIGSLELLGPGQQIIIAHRGEDYRLRITSKGKLLLTK